MSWLKAKCYALCSILKNEFTLCQNNQMQKKATCYFEGFLLLFFTMAFVNVSNYLASGILQNDWKISLLKLEILIILGILLLPRFFKKIIHLSNIIKNNSNSYCLHWKYQFNTNNNAYTLILLLWKMYKIMVIKHSLFYREFKSLF